MDFYSLRVGSKVQSAKSKRARSDIIGVRCLYWNARRKRCGHGEIIARGVANRCIARYRDVASKGPSVDRNVFSAVGESVDYVGVILIHLTRVCCC